MSSCSKDDYHNDQINGFIIYYQGGSSSQLTYFIKNLDNGETRLLGFDGYLGSNYGGKIGCTNYKGRFYVLNAKTLDTIISKELSYPIYNFSWSPDDKDVAFIIPPNIIRKLNITTFEHKDLIIPIELTLTNEIHWSATNSLIYFTNFQNSIGRICSIEPNGSDFKMLTEGMFIHNVAISPDGKTIVYDDGFGYYLIDTDGKNKRYLWDAILYPKWSKDGSAIMANFRNYIDFKTSRWDIRLKEINGQQRETKIINENYILIDWFFE